MKNLICSCVAGGVALAAGALCHRYAPGLGVVLMPMFWPLAVLAARVPAKWSLTTAALVPFVSLALTGMPVFPFVVALKFVACAALVRCCFVQVLKVHKKEK